MKILGDMKYGQVAAVRKLAIDSIFQMYTSNNFTTIEDIKLSIEKGVDL